MATSFWRRRDGVPATPPKFFKIILHPESDTLNIPTVFTRRHGPDLRNRVFLKVPEGSAMEVELIQSNCSNGEAWLQKGWLEFKKHYSIGFGYLLFFIYNGNSQFDVLIFDTSASEITYPVEETQSESESDDDSVVMLTNLQVSRNPPATKQRKCLNESSTSGSRNQLSSIRNSKESKGVAGERCIAYQKALAYTSHKPFIITLMQPSYVSYRFSLNVPVSFAKKCLLPIGDNKLHLMMNGRKWEVICSVYRGFRKANLSSGWKEFVQDNGLKVGDACVFEAHKSHELVWNVMVFPS